MIKIIIIDDENNYEHDLPHRINFETGCDVLAIIKPWEGKLMTRYLKSAGQVEYELEEEDEDE